MNAIRMGAGSRAFARPRPQPDARHTSPRNREGQSPVKARAAISKHEVMYEVLQHVGSDSQMKHEQLKRGRKSLGVTFFYFVRF